MEKVGGKEMSVQWPERVTMCQHGSLNPQYLCVHCNEVNEAIDACIEAYEASVGKGELVPDNEQELSRLIYEGEGLWKVWHNSYDENDKFVGKVKAWLVPDELKLIIKKIITLRTKRETDLVGIDRHNLLVQLGLIYTLPQHSLKEMDSTLMIDIANMVKNRYGQNRLPSVEEIRKVLDDEHFHPINLKLAAAVRELLEKPNKGS